MKPRTLRTSDGFELSYWIAVSEPPAKRLLMTLHGAASNHTRWEEFIEFTKLQESWTLIAPDARGNGESMTRKGQRREVWVRDLVEIMDAEGYASAVVLGHSLGAQIAIHLAHAEPERVDGLALLDPVFSNALQGKQRTLWRWRWLVRGLRRLIRVLNVLGLRRRRIPNRSIRKLDEETRLALQGEESFEQIAKRYSALTPILECMPTANYLAQVMETLRPLPSLKEIRVPVVVFVSGGTTMADNEVVKREIAAFPNAEVVTLEANHWPLTEAPVATREAIEAWVDKAFPG